MSCLESVRFASDTVNAGSDSPKYRGMVVNGLPQVLDRDWFYLTLKDFCLITGSIKKPTWATDLAGTAGHFSTCRAPPGSRTRLCSRSRLAFSGVTRTLPLPL